MNKTIPKLTIIVAVLLMFTLSATAAQFNKALVPADAQWVVHIDMNRFNKTLLKKLIFDDEDMKELNETKDQVMKEYKIDFLKDIHGITAFGMKSEQDKMVLICKGSFDRNYLLGKIKGVKKFEQLKHGNYTIYSWSKNDFALFADDGLLLYGKTEESLKNTLDVLKRRKKNLASSELMSYVKMIPPDAFLIAASTDISELGKGKGPQGMILGNTGVATFMSMERNKNLALKIMMKSASEDDARNVENVIRGLMALASLKVDEEIKPFLDLLSAVDINRKGAILEIGFEYPSEKLVRLVIDKTKHKKHKHDK